MLHLAKHIRFSQPPLRWAPVHIRFSQPFLATADPNLIEFPQAQPDPQDEIIVAMSGGVDSSFTAALYASTYKNVRAIYMANWSQTAKCTELDWNDVKKVCERLQIRCERVNFEREYWSDVFSPMVESYLRGQTPNPDLGCNRHIKFGKMFEHLNMTQNMAEGRKNWLATGHYARVVAENGGYSLARALEDLKDQLYYLASIDKSVLKHVLMPLGHYRKQEVRRLAKEKYGLHTAAKPDSTGLCFVNPNHTKFRDFLNEYIPPNPGNIITEDGKVWGRHQGLWHATIGQKLGITMPQGDPNYKGVWFVSEKRVQTNEIVIVRGRDNPKLYKNGLYATEWAWFGEKPVDLALKSVSMRYQSLHVPVSVTLVEEIPGDNVKIILKDKQRAMAPGQNVVLYDGYKVLASGKIAQTFDEQ